MLIRSAISCFILDPADNERFTKNPLNAHKRRQGTIWVLLDIANLGAVPLQHLCIHPGYILAFKDHMTFGWFIQTQDGFHQTGLSATTFANHGNGFTMFNIKGYIIHGVYITGMSKTKAPELKPNFQILDG